MQGIGPLFIAAMASPLPELLYPNWRCDEQYRTFVAHVKRMTTGAVPQGTGRG